MASSKKKITTTTTGSAISELRGESQFTGQLKPLLKKQYGIFLWDMKTNKTSSKKGLNPADPGASAAYYFSMAPKVHEMSDPFTTQITPTQSGGKFVESHGSILKPIRISGTTGIRPNRSPGEHADIPLIGTAIEQLTSDFNVLTFDKWKSAPPSEATGFDDIIFLRNIFRAYSDYRENNSPSNHIVMVWYNAKEGDSWIVEPGEFKLQRNASSPLTYEYSVQLTTLAPFTGSVSTDTDDPMQKVLDVRKVLSRVQEYNNSLRRSFLVISTQIRRLEGLGVFAETQLLDPIINVTRGLGVIRATAATFGTRLRHNTLVLSQELDNAIDLLTGTPGVEAQDALVRTLRRTQVTSARILAEPGVRDSVGTQSSAAQSRYSASYVTGGDTAVRSRRAPDLGDSSIFVGSTPITNLVGQDFVHVGEDIRSIAGRLLGDKGSWHIIATINNLSSPYISSDGRTGTLQPGDIVLYPSADEGVDIATINPVNTSDSETSGKDTNTLGPSQQAYGRDIRLTSNVVGGVDRADLATNQRGDISTIVGIPNVEQAVIIRFSTEKGELPAHPGFGASFPIGSKAATASINDFRVQTTATLISDQRVKEIKNINFVTVGDILVVNATLLLTGTTDSLNTSVSLRRV